VRHITGGDLGLAPILNEDDGKGRHGSVCWYADVQGKQVDAVAELVLGK